MSSSFEYSNSFNVSSLYLLTRTTSISPGQFFQHLQRPFEPSLLHRHLIILRIYWTAASISVSTGINLFDFTAQRHSIARRLLPSFYCVIWKNVWTLWYLKADFGWRHCSRFDKRFYCSYFLNRLFVVQEIEGMVGVALQNNIFLAGFIS